MWAPIPPPPQGMTYCSVLHDNDKSERRHRELMLVETLFLLLLFCPERISSFPRRWATCWAARNCAPLPEGGRDVCPIQLLVYRAASTSQLKPLPPTT